MGRIFVSAGNEEFAGTHLGAGMALADGSGLLELMTVRDLLVAELRSRGFAVVTVPDELSMPQMLQWINRRDRSGDVALNLQIATHANPTFRGTSVYYIANNTERKHHAELLLLALTRRLPDLAIRGALPDTQSVLGTLPYCRHLRSASLYVELGFITSAGDRDLLQNRQREIVVGLADGLATWSRTVAEAAMTKRLDASLLAATVGEIATPIAIQLNGRTYGEQGIFINGNACVPIDLVERLGITLRPAAQHSRKTYGHVVYMKAIDLREYDIAVTWESETQTVQLQTALALGQTVHPLSGLGHTSEVQLLMFLKSQNEDGLAQFPEIGRLYRDEGVNERINYDIAFAQMCVETDFLRFGGIRRANQHNFGGLGAVNGAPEGATFSSTRIGVRAHIQHLKAYANTEPLREEGVDPRFHLVARGIAPTLEQLDGRWSATPHYSDRVLAVLRQLYETAKLL